MLSMLQAHGLDAGPTQRPLLCGAISGLIANAPATAMLVIFGSLEAAVQGLGIGPPAVLAAFCVLNLIAGIAYGWLFQRAANDIRGGWLFGLSFGFVVWMLVPIPILQWLPDRPLLTGFDAIGLLLGQWLWGLVLGVLFPFVHRRLHVKLHKMPTHSGTGPESMVRGLLRRG